MRTTHAFASVLAMTTAVLLGGCSTVGAPSSAVTYAAPSAPGAAAAWPASLKVVGNGFPNPGDPCRVIGESAATVDLLDDSARLVGCLDKTDAAKLAGRQLGPIDGVALVSVPNTAAAARAGDGDGQGDALVAGTGYNATAQIRCEGLRGAPAGLCDAGVKRNAELGSAVDVNFPNGGQRTIFFDKQGKFLTVNANQADGSAALTPVAQRVGDTTIVRLGKERYEIPDAFVLGD
ncbi:hypothetical protein [Methyloterricola oryzae]|uniref:hypothetical protein n=1 Tax=Methyloterricola oryzae TaxID=1495050 RepID=UPI00069946A0|nr:hypothetical protein [Methyloterricola oryzae]